MAAPGPEPLGGYRPDRILIKPTAGTVLSGLSEFHAVVGARVLRQFDWLEGIQELQLPGHASVPEWVRLCEDTGWVEFAEPDYLLHLATVPDDPHYLSGSCSLHRLVGSSW